MKRISVLAAILLAAAAVACKPQPKENPNAPQIAWTGHEDWYAPEELGDEMKTAFTITASGEIAKLTVQMECQSKWASYYSGLLDATISVEANKPINRDNKGLYDLVSDQTAATNLKSSLSGGKTSVSLSVEQLLGIITSSSKYPENDDKFIFTFVAEDAAGLTTSRTAIFHWTALPTFSWPGNSTFVTTTNNTDWTIRIDAPAGIRDFWIEVQTSSADYLNYLKTNISIEANKSGDKPVLNLIADPKLKLIPNLQTGEDLAGQVHLDFSIAGLVEALKLNSPEAESSHQFTLNIRDRLGREVGKDVFVTVK